MKAPLIILLALLAAPVPALAHVVAAPGEAKAGSYSAIAFRVGHACAAGDTTLKLRVEIPDAVVSARPQPKPGWTIDIEKDGEKATAVTWTGRLPDDQFDDFALLMKLPSQPGNLVFPVIQSCEKGESQWTEIPDPDRPGEKLTRPAPTVRLIPAAEQTPPMPDMPGMKH
ncbi:nuclear export factor GLE1 [Caulobacter sp. Root487D2Y]|uniref:YcnI family protein n=1 Tax=Caulobacter sp. Root487D2Y TaxID=1736547 RepID=UPI0007004593|nr:YcnI family protein [Caulobacter sp. Root487D2Y]KQY35534.1 nuclear export factor GLE1 [Caulobacter sp. Root487D2Y]